MQNSSGICNFRCYAKFHFIFIFCVINLCKLQGCISKSIIALCAHGKHARVKYRKHFYRLTDLHDRLKELFVCQITNKSHKEQRLHVVNVYRTCKQNHLAVNSICSQIKLIPTEDLQYRSSNLQTPFRL